MADDFLEFYRKNLSMGVLILNHMKFVLTKFLMYTLVDIASIIWIYTDNGRTEIPRIINFLLFFIGLGLLYWLNHEKEKIINNKYQGSLSKEKSKRGEVCNKVDRIWKIF